MSDEADDRDIPTPPHEAQGAVDDDKISVIAEVLGEPPLLLAHARLELLEWCIRRGLGNRHRSPSPSSVDVWQLKHEPGSADDDPHNPALAKLGPISVLDDNRAARMPTGDSSRNPSGCIVDLVEGGLATADAIDEGQSRCRAIVNRVVAAEVLTVLHEFCIAGLSFVLDDHVGRAVVGGPIFRIDTHIRRPTVRGSKDRDRVP